MNNEDHTRGQLATLRQAKNNLQSEVQDHRVDAVEGISCSVDPIKVEDKRHHGIATIVTRMNKLQADVVTS